MGAFASCAAVQPVAASAAAVDAAAVDAGVGVDEVIVTARRRQERAQDVPLALTVIGGDRLEKANISTLDQLKQQAPSLQLFAINPRNTAVNIRGLGSNASVSGDGLESGVGVYVDDVYYARPGQGVFDLIDIDHIEILRGPQGTLFGKNTTAGAISITTRRPNLQAYEAVGELSVGDYNYWQARAAVSGPIVEDRLALRLTASKAQRDGFISNIRTGRDSQDLNSESLRGQLLFTPTADLSLRFTADYARRAEQCCVSLVAGVITTLPSGVALANNFYARAARVGYVLPSTDPANRVTDVDSDASYVVENKGLAANIEWARPDFVLTSVTAYRKWDWLPHNDSDGVGLPIQTLSQTTSHQKQFSQELRLASAGERRLDYVVGAYYFHQKLPSVAYTQYGAAGPDFILPQATAPAIRDAALNGFTFRGVSVADTDSYAVFGQTTFKITPKLSLTTGLRYTREKKTGSFAQVQTGGVDLATLPPAVAAAAQAIRNTYGPQSSYTARTNESNLSGQANLAYAVTPDLLAYVTYARGYKSGGLNLANLPPGAKSTVSPEKVKSYEAGVKSQWLDRRLTLNATAFLTDVADYQSINSVPGISLVYLANAAKVRSKGVEVELAATPIEGLSLNAGATYAETVYRDYANAPCAFGRTAPCSLTGTRLPNAPLWSTSAGAEYAHPVPGLQGQAEGYVGADYSYRSSYNSASDNGFYGVVKGYEITNLRVGVRRRDGSWDAYLWARNLFDEDYLQRRQLGPFNAGLLLASIGDPRTVGVTLRARR